MQANFQPAALFVSLLFVAVWCVMNAVSSLLVGWYQLSRRFRADSKPVGATMWGQVMAVCSWQHSLMPDWTTVLAVSPAGLYLRTWLMFRFMRPPVLVPWHEVRYVAVYRSFWPQTHVFSLGGQMEIRVRQRAFLSIQAFLAEVPPAMVPSAAPPAGLAAWIGFDEPASSSQESGTPQGPLGRLLAGLDSLANLAAVLFNAVFSVLAIVTLCGIVFITRPQQVMHEIHPSMWLPLLIVMAPAQLYSQFLTWSTVFAGRAPTGPAIAMRQPSVPSALKLLIAIWWLCNFLIEIAIVVSLSKPDPAGRQASTVVLFIVALIAFWLSFAANVYLLLAVRTLTAGEEPLRRLWQWRIVIDLAIAALAVLYYGV